MYDAKSVKIEQRLDECDHAKRKIVTCKK